MSGSVIAQPEVTIALANANLAVQNTNQRVLAVGQKTAAGTHGGAGGLLQNVGDDFDALFGPRSQLAGLMRGYKRVNPVVKIDAIVLDDDGSGVPRVVTFTLLGTATAAGSLRVVLGSELDHVITVPIAIGDTLTNIADALTTAAALDLKAPFTVGNTAGLVTITAANDGTIANDLGIEVEIIDATGITITVALTETTPGSVDPTLTGILDVATDRYQTIIWPYADQTVPAAYLLPRFNPTNNVLDGVSVTTIVDTATAAETTLNLLNDKNLVIFVDEVTAEITGQRQYLGPAQNEATYVKSALFSGIRALRLTDGQIITQFLTSSASLDQFGGPAIASLPYFNTPMTFLPTIRPGRGFTNQEIEDIATAGGGVMGVNRGGTGALVGEVPTTFKTDSASNPDRTFKFLNFVDTGSNSREYFFNNLKARFAQSRLTEGAVSRGRDMANEVVIGAFLDKLYNDLAGPNFVLVQDGEAAIKFFKQNRTIVLDLATGKATITARVPIVTQLRTIIMTMNITFSALPS